MNSFKIIGFCILAFVWLWLAWYMLKYSGITLYNLIIVAMTGIIVFVPLYRKYLKK